MAPSQPPAPADIGHPPGPTERADVEPWITARARALLDDVDLVCDGRRHRIREIELYLTCAEHPDPFVHGVAEQQRPGAWYFHRSGASYRGGTFKGLDLATGGPGVACGWLLRSVEAEDGRLIDGSCNVVDHLLGVAGERHIAPLDRGSPDALDGASRLHLAPALGARGSPILGTPRVGLTLKRADTHPGMPSWIGRRLRFLTAPRRIRKGRVQTIAALLADGLDIEAIHRVTGSPRAALRRAAEAFEAGRARDPAEWLGVRLARGELYGLYGAALTR